MRYLVICCFIVSLGASEHDVGVSPGALSHWSTQWCFTDQFAHSLPWRSSDKAVPLVLDEHGWVRELAAGQTAWSLVHTKAGPHYLGGTWIATYEGSGELRFSQAASETARAPGRIELAVDPTRDGGVKVELLRSDPADPLRDLRLIPAELIDHDSAFHPRFLELMQGFDIVRCTGLMRTGGGAKRAGDWAGRPTTQHQTQAGKRGMAVEHAIALCNKLEADCWITVPVTAEEVWVRGCAELVRDGLDEDLRIYVEYGNDVGVWPTGSSQYCIKQGLAAGLSEDHHQARSRYYAQRSAEIFAVWKEVFAGDQRLRCALDVFDEQVCTWPEGGESAGELADVSAIVALFGGDFGRIQNIDHLLATDLDTLMDELAEQAQVHEGVIEELERAHRYELEPMSFYLTPIIAPIGPIAQKHGEEVQRQVEAKTLAMLMHPRMERIYRDFIASWHAAGGGAWIHPGFVHQPGQWGWFGLLQHMDQDPVDSPKFRAVRASMLEETQP